MLIMLPQTDLKEIVMRRVRVVFIVRSLIVPVALELGVVGGFVAAIVGFVSVGDVFANMRQAESIGSVFSYSYQAVLHTELFVQMGMVLALLASGYFTYRLVKTFRSASFRGDAVQA